MAWTTTCSHSPPPPNGRNQLFLTEKIIGDRTTTGKPMNQATAKINGQEKPADDLIREFCQNLENCNSIEDGFTIITSLFESLDVTIERITLVRDGETSEVTLNENASGI